MLLHLDLRSWLYLIVPGTTVGVTLLPGYVEIRDKGLVKKKILTKNKSFEIVLEEVESYFRYLGKRLAPSLLKDILIKIGLPQVRLIIEDDEIVPEETESLADTDTPEVVESDEPVTMETRKEQLARTREVKEAKETEKPPEKPEKPKPEVPVIIGDKELADIQEALDAVETLSDSFMAPSSIQTESDSEDVKPKIRIDIQGTDEIVASETSRATTGKMVESIEETEAIEERAESIVESEELIEETETHSEAAVEETTEPEVSLVEEIPDEEPEEEAAEPVSVPPIDTPAHVVKPLVETKALLLGEENVGKNSLISGASLESVLTEDYSSPYVHDKVFELTNYRAKLHVWSFDQASEMKVPRQEFYDAAAALIIVYSAVDRWSFQSLDFWLKEAMVVCKSLPPLIIVGNKVDLRDNGQTRSGDRPVSKDEGFKMAESLAKKHGQDNKLHPVAFIEASCITGEGVEAVFKTAAELSLRWKPSDE